MEKRGKVLRRHPLTCYRAGGKKKNGDRENKKDARNNKVKDRERQMRDCHDQ